MIGAVLPWKPRLIRLQLQVSARCCVGIHFCNIIFLLQDLALPGI